MSTTCETLETIEHVLKDCTALAETRRRLHEFTLDFSADNPEAASLLTVFCNPANPHFCQFLVDCSVLPEVILAYQSMGSSILDKLFTVTRIWCYSLHRERLKILGKWTHGHKF